jgi:hypothetical protein
MSEGSAPEERGVPLWLRLMRGWLEAATAKE